MINVTFLAIAAIAAVVIILVCSFRNRLMELIWKIFIRRISDEKLERIVRKQYEAFEINRKAYNEEGLGWLLEMANYLSHLWSSKLALAKAFCGEDFPDHIRQDRAAREQEQSRILTFWQDAALTLTYELNRRKYFNT